MILPDVNTLDLMKQLKLKKPDIQIFIHLPYDKKELPPLKEPLWDGLIPNEIDKKELINLLSKKIS